MRLSVIIPARNEEGCIEETMRLLVGELTAEKIVHEILVIDDNSTDRTAQIVRELASEFKQVKYVHNLGPNGFGMAIRKGLETFEGDVAAIYMADNSDSPKDLVQFYRTLITHGVDCVFGDRWSKSSHVYDYPWIKLALNRTANLFIQFLFGLKYGDVTNAFKMYRREVIQGLKPFLSMHFNLTVELPLKAIIRGYSFRIISNDWTNRKAGVSKLKIKEMGSRYLFIILYCFLEKWLSRNDYHRDSNVLPMKRISSAQEKDQRAA